MAMSSLNPFNFEKPAAWGSGAGKHLEHIARGQHNQASNGAFDTTHYSEGSDAQLQQQGSDICKTSSHEDIKKWLNAPAGERAGLTL